MNVLLPLHTSTGKPGKIPSTNAIPISIDSIRNRFRNQVSFLLETDGAKRTIFCGFHTLYS